MTSGTGLITLTILSILGLSHALSVASPYDKRYQLPDHLQWINNARNPAKGPATDGRQLTRKEVTKTNKTRLDVTYQNDQSHVEETEYQHGGQKRPSACKSANSFLKTKLKNLRHQYKQKMKAIKKIIIKLLDDSFDDPNDPVADFCTVNGEVVEVPTSNAPLNDENIRAANSEEPCKVSPWSEWRTLAFGTLERRREVEKDGCGCPPEDELVQVIDVGHYLGNNTSPKFQNPDVVGNNFDEDFLNHFGGNNGEGGNNGGKGGDAMGYGDSDGGSNGRINGGNNGINNGNNNSGSNGSSSNGSSNGSNNGSYGNGGGYGNGGNNGGNGIGSNNGGNGNGGTGNGNDGSNNIGNGGSGSRSAVRDILLVLDSSGSIDTDDFELMKDGVVMMIDLFCGGFGHLKTNNRLALVQFASNVTVIHRFSDSQYPADLKAKVQRLRHYKGNTCTGNALKTAMKRVFSFLYGMRDYTVKDTLIVTDGQSNCGIDIRQAASSLQEASNVFALGVGIAGKVKARDEVKSVVSMEDPHHIFSLAKFADFKAMVENLKRHRARNNPCTPIQDP